MADQLRNELLEDQVIIGERNYEQALDMVIARATRQLLIFDKDFSKGAYASLRRAEAIRDFLAKDRQNRLAIVLHDAGYFNAHCPRLRELLAIYSHAMTIYQTGEQARGATDSFVIADQQHYVRRFHIDHARFRFAFNDEETAGMLNSRFNELLETCSDSLTATRLGL